MGWVFWLMMVLPALIGVALLVFAIKRIQKGLLRRFLLTAGASLVGFPIFAVLHNLVYGLFIYLFGADFWSRTGIEDEPVFFIIAVIICPLGLLVGAIGSLVLGAKKLAAKRAPRIVT